MDMDMNEDAGEVGEVGEKSAPYWPADEAMRLECLRLATQGTAIGDPRSTLEAARRFYDFVSGKTEISATVDLNIEIP